jgi:hypothetical protein
LLVVAHASIIRDIFYICATKQNCNVSKTFVLISMSVTLTHSRHLLLPVSAIIAIVGIASLVLHAARAVLGPHVSEKRTLVTATGISTSAKAGYIF